GSTLLSHVASAPGVRGACAAADNEESAHRAKLSLAIRNFLVRVRPFRGTTALRPIVLEVFVSSCGCSSRCLLCRFNISKPEIAKGFRLSFSLLCPVRNSRFLRCGSSKTLGIAGLGSSLGSMTSEGFHAPHFARWFKTLIIGSLGIRITPANG